MLSGQTVRMSFHSVNFSSWKWTVADTGTSDDILREGYTSQPVSTDE